MLIWMNLLYSINAFELMRIASMQNYLPEFNASRNSFDQLRIDLCEWIKTNGGGWIGRDNANTMEKIYHRFIKISMVH